MSSQPSGVWRDPHGIPHIRAGSVCEVAWLQGWATARDRAWQLEIERLRGEGRTAELLGSAGVEWDTFARRARIPAVAQAAYANLDDEAQAFLTSYAAGVAASLPGATAPELADLGPAPGAWQPWTPLAIFLVQQILFGPFPSQLFHARARDVLGPDADLFRTEGLAGGSNAYAVGSERTAGGAPIVAGDPHRLFEAPNVYLQVRLACTAAGDEFDVVGFTFPGVPGVQHFAHAGGVAWGVTNAMADYQDLVPLSSCEVLSRSVEQVLVRDGAPVPVDVAVTDRGPVVLPGLVLQTSSHTLGGLGFGALLPLLRSRTATDVEHALEAWVEPVNNWVIADSTGSVVHTVVGRVPSRAGDGTWSGWVTPLPRRTADADGAVVTANDRSNAAYDVLAEDFAPPFRADRISSLLDDSGPLDARSAVAVLSDVKQTAGDPLLALVPADLRPSWNGAMDGSSGAAWYAALRDEVVERICAADVLAPLREPSDHGPLYEPWSALASRVAVSLHVILAAEKPFGLDVTALVAEAAATVAERAHTAWPDRHLFWPLHALEQFELPHHRSVPATPLPGDTDTVRCNAWLPGAPVTVRGSVARYAWDLADRSRSLWAVPLGASGDPASPHFTNQHDSWASGGALPLETTWEQLSEEELTPPITLRLLDPVGDLDDVFAWVSAPRATYWGMTGKPREEVGEIYAWLQEQEHLAAYIIEVDGAPVGILQTYDPFVDEIGDYYDRRPGDLGVHLHLADTPARKGHSTDILAFLVRWVFAQPGVDRMVAEPDTTNNKSLLAFGRAGMVAGPQVQLPHKVAQFAFLERSAYEEFRGCCPPVASS